MKLLGIAVNRDRSAWTIFANDHLLLFGVTFHQVQGASQRVAKVVADPLHLGWTRKVQESLDRALHPLNLLENDVRPLFYDRAASGIPERWVRKMKHAMRTLIPRFTAERMLRGYITDMYAPDAVSST